MNFHKWLLNLKKLESSFFTICIMDVRNPASGSVIKLYPARAVSSTFLRSNLLYWTSSGNMPKTIFGLHQPLFRLIYIRLIVLTWYSGGAFDLQQFSISVLSTLTLLRTNRQTPFIANYQKNADWWKTINHYVTGAKTKKCECGKITSK